MSHSIFCRLCVNDCSSSGYKNLYDVAGNQNEAYSTAIKYFDSVLFSVTNANHSDVVVCLQCWCHIFDFHNFQQSVALAQKQFKNKIPYIILNEYVDNQTDISIDNLNVSSGKISSIQLEKPGEHIVECNETILGGSFYDDIVIKEEKIEEIDIVKYAFENEPPENNCVEENTVQHKKSLNKKRFFCKLCSRSFGRRFNYIRHMVTQHDYKKEDVPRDCIKDNLAEFETDSSHSKTIFVQEEKEEIDCAKSPFDKEPPENICIERNSVRRSKSRNKKSSFCKVCKRFFERRFNYIRHMVAQHGYTKEDVSREYIDDILTEFEPDSRYAETIIVKEDVELEDIGKQSHENHSIEANPVQRNESVNNKGFVCKVCQKFFQRKFNYIRHMVNQHEYTKEEVSREYIKDKLAKLKSNRPCSKTKVVGCKWCGKLFFKANNLIRHLHSQHDIPKHSISQRDIINVSSNITPDNCENQYNFPEESVQEICANPTDNLNVLCCDMSAVQEEKSAEHIMECSKPRLEEISYDDIVVKQEKIEDIAKYSFNKQPPKNRRTQRNSVQRNKSLKTKSFFCKLCQKFVKRRFNYFRHMVTQHGYTKEDVSREYTKEKLTELKRSRRYSKTKVAGCNWCGRLFFKVDNLIRHLSCQHDIPKHNISQKDVLNVPSNIIPDNFQNQYTFPEDSLPENKNDPKNANSLETSEDGYFNDDHEATDNGLIEVKTMESRFDTVSEEILLPESLQKVSEPKDIPIYNATKFYIQEISETPPIHTSPTNVRRNWTTQELDDYIAAWRPHLECRLCNDLYTNFDLLKNHYGAKHPGEEFYVSCCKSKFKSRSPLVEHIHFHSNPNVFQCEFCVRSFTKAQSLQTHVLNIHNMLVDKVYISPKSTCSTKLNSIKQNDDDIDRSLPIASDKTIQSRKIRKVHRKSLPKKN